MQPPLEEAPPAAARPAFSIVVPTLDEAENVDELLRQIFALRDCPPFEVVVVDDDSKDGTAERARAWSASHPVRVVVRRGARGLAGAVILGARESGADVVVVMDADLSHPVAAIPALAHAVLEGKADVAVGSRHTRGGAIRGWPLHRRVVSRIASSLAWPISAVSDPMSGFFAVPRRALLGLGEAPAGFKILLELLSRGGSDLRAVEVPITFTDRVRGESKLGVTEVGQYLGRLATFAGADIGSAALRRLLTVLAAGSLLDLGLFAALERAGSALGTAQLAGAAAAFTAAASLCARELGRGRILRLAAVGALAALLRGGLLATLLRTGSLSPVAAFLPAAALGLAVSALGAAFWVLAPERGPGQRAVALRVGCLAVLGYLLLLRVVYAGALELLPEEAYYWSYSRHLELSYLDHPPLVAWLISLGTALFGHGEWGVRAPSILCSLATAGFSGALAYRWLGKTAAAVCLALVAALPFSFTSGVVMTPDAPLAAAWTGALLFLWCALVEERPRAWWGAGACLGLGLLAKYTIALLGLGALAFALLDRRARAQLARPEPWAGAALTLVLFSPVVAWNAENHWASFLFQSSRRLDEPPEFALHRLAGGVALLLTPLAIAGLAALASRPLRGELGRGDASTDSARGFRFAALAAFAPVVVFAAFSLSHVPKLNWTGPAWFALLPAVAGVLALAPERDSSRAGRLAVRLLAPSLWVALFAWAGLLHALALGVPGSRFPDGTRYAQRWNDIAAAVDRTARELGAASGETPVIVAFDRYSTPSLLAFYQPPGGPRWTVGGRSLFGAGQSLMYGYWTPPQSVAGRTLLCVSDERHDLDIPPRFARQLGEIAGLRIDGGTRGCGGFYTRALYGYVPDSASGTKRKNAAASSTALSGASSSHIEPSSRMPSAARASSPSSSGLAGLALPSDSRIFGTHSGRGSPLVSNATPQNSGPSLNTQSTPAPRSSAEGSVNIDARPRTPSSSSSKSPSTSG